MNRATARTPRTRVWRERSRFWLLVALIAACFLWGGASRLDIPYLIWLQPLAIVLSAAIVLVPGPIRWEAIRAPLLMLLALALLIAVQMIPLPPALWRALPGYDQFLPFLEVAGGQDLWRPISVTPDLTLAALVGLSMPLAALIGFAGIMEEDSRRLVPILLIAVALSVVVGLGQIVGGPQSSFYRYAITNVWEAVGFFSNRNHFALFLAMAWPLLALWVTSQTDDPRQRRLRRWIGAAAAIALLPMVAVTGSRAGLFLAPIGIAFGWWLLRLAARSADLPSDGLRRRSWAVALTMVLGALAMLAIAFSLSRAESVQRLVATNFWEEARLAYIPTLWRIAIDFLPFGAGFGSFDPIFRFYEPDSLLGATYLNHAHNDLLEIVITGGFPALLLVAVFIAWCGRRALMLRGNLRGSTRGRLALLGVALIVLTLLASLADYPLRTPLHAMLLAFACGWLAEFRPENRGQVRGDSPLRPELSGLDASQC